MTPPAVQLQFHLDQRYRWFLSWLFKWHHIGRGPIEIDMFDGRSAHLGGICFDGSARLTYWDAVVRGVRKEVVERLA